MGKFNKDVLDHISEREGLDLEDVRISELNVEEAMYAWHPRSMNSLLIWTRTSSSLRNFRKVSISCRGKNSENPNMIYTLWFVG
ncbi:hypothetical protein K1719_015641 [Acacia pycnantha]|nr:hypothetical protein K1719_015641 [Acacia pycnantha]